MSHLPNLKGKQVLITGGAGFIGSNLAIRLVKERAKVTVIDSLIPEMGGNLFNLEPVKNEIKNLKIDLRENRQLSEALQGQEYIFNLAGQVSHQDSMSDPIADLEINAKAPLNLLETCRRDNPNATIIYTGTRQVYGVPRYLPVDENHPVNPVDINGINSYAGEQFHSLYSKVYGLKTVSLRLTNTFGPRQLIKHARQGFIGWFINRALTGNPIELFGGGKQIRDFSFVEDVLDALLLAATTPDCYGRVFNLSGEKTSLESVAGRLIEIWGLGSTRSVPFPENLKKIDIGDYYGSSETFNRATGWVPQTELGEGFRQTLEYFQNNKKFYLES